MDFSKLTYEQFSEPLRSRSEAEIRGMLIKEGLRFPAVESKEHLLQAAFDALRGKQGSKDPIPAGASTSAETSPSAVPSKPAGSGRRFKVRCIAGVRYRAGHKWTTAYQVVFESQFSEAEWTALKADASLQVREISDVTPAADVEG